MTPDEYLEMIIEPAKEVCASFSLPWQCCVAQGALESQWGTYGLGNGGFNIFGRKAVDGDASVTVETQECYDGQWVTIEAAFKSYDSMDEAVRDWCILITEEPCYAECLDYRDDLESFVRTLAPIYATDPEYAEKILQTIRACAL